MSGTVLHHLSIRTLLGGDAISPILQIRTLRLRVVKECVQGHTAYRRQA